MNNRVKRKLMTLVVMAVVGLYTYYQKNNRNPNGGGGGGSGGTSAPREQVGSYETMSNCRIVDDRGNDGDSFIVKHDGGQHLFRLYFVDSPEKYRHQHNGDRIADQGRYYGGLSEKQVIGVGEDARDFAMKTLKSQKFTVETKWAPVYTNERFYAFVKVGDRYLSEMLSEQGLVRLRKTVGADVPDGRSKREFAKHLDGLEKKAKQQRLGGWKK